MAIDHRALAQLAQGQHGAFSHEQAAAHGATRSTIALAVETGRWRRAARGVYVLAGHAPTLAQRASVASLARPDGLVAYLTAAHLAGWVTSSPHLPTLLVPPRASARSSVATIRRSAFAPGDRALIVGIAATSPARTLVDLASEVGPRRLRHLVDQAMHRRSTTTATVLAQMERTPRFPGAARRALLDALEPWAASIRPGTAAEAHLFRLITSWGFPPPEREIEILDHDGKVVARADGGWPRRRVAFEYDSREFHGPQRWAADEARHRAIGQLGWTLLHADAADLRPGERSFRDQLHAAWERRAEPIDRDRVR